MGYRLAPARDDAETLAGILHSAPGFPGYPVRLADEIFRRARQLLPDGRVTVWDPCCGSGQLLTVIAAVHRPSIRQVIATDVDPGALRLASRNLGLLSQEGLRARAAELDERAVRFGKPHYAHLADGARRVARNLAAHGGDVPVALGPADALDPAALAEALRGARPDLVITDVPYGEQTSWQGRRADAGVDGLLEALAAVLHPRAVLVVSARGRAVPLGGRPRLGAFRVGRRAVSLLRARP